MFWFVLLLINVGLTVVGQLLRPRGPSSGPPRPSGLGDFSFPTAMEGRPPGIALGTVKVSGANCLWWGDLEAQPIKVPIDGGLGGPKHIWSGFRYLIGMQLGICLGPIDELVQVLFDDKLLAGSGRNVIDATNNQIVFGPNPTPWYTATIPVGIYDNATALANAAETAMVTASSASGWKVVYGFHLIPGRSDRVVYSCSISGVSTKVTVDVPGVYQDGDELARALTLAFNNAENRAFPGAPRAHFNWLFTGATLETRKFALYVDTVLPGLGVFQGFTVYGNASGPMSYANTALAHLGFQLGADHFHGGAFGPLTGDFMTRPDAYMFAYAGTTGKLRLSDAAFTSARLFGAETGTDQTIGEYVAPNGVPVPDFSTIDDSTDLALVTVNAPNLFGGESSEGGVVGTIAVFKGTTTQLADGYMESVRGRQLPAYRHLCYAVFRHLYLATSNYLKSPSFVVRRCPNGLGLTGGDENINGDANPAAAIYDLLTNTVWGCGLDSGLIGSTFATVGATLATEELGISFLFDSQQPAGDIIAEILRHIDGVMYADPVTGKLEIALARPDYDPDDLDVYDESSLDEIEFSRPSWAETKNDARVNYINRAQAFTQRTVQAQDLANLELRSGDHATEQFDFLGLSNAVNAQITVDRVLRTISAPLGVMQAKSNRSGWTLRPGMLFKLSSATYGLVEKVMRVTRVALGTLSDGRITVHAVEDIFGGGWSTGAPGAGGGDPSAEALALEASRLEETPYPQAGGAHKRITTLGVPVQTGITLGYKVWSDPAGGGDFAETNDVATLTPSGGLVDAITETSQVFVIAAGALLAQLISANAAQFAAGVNIAIIDNEWIAWRDVTHNIFDGSYLFGVLARGVIDTVPAHHAQGARVWFVSAGSGTAQTADYSADDLITAKLRSYNALNTQPLELAALLSLQLNSRALRPYVPTAIKLNGASYPASISGPLTVSWIRRNRLAAWNYADSGANDSLESGQHTRVRVYGETGALLHTEEGLDGDSWAFSSEAELAAGNGGSHQTAVPTTGGAGNADWGFVGAGSFAAALSDSSDSSYARWDASVGFGSTLQGNLGSLTDPGTRTGLSIKLTVRGSTGGPTNSRMNVIIKSGATVVKNFFFGSPGNTMTPDEFNATGSFAEYTVTLSAAEAALLDFVSGQPFTYAIAFSGIGGGQTIDVSHIGLDLPPVNLQRLNNSLRIVIESYVGSLLSWQAYDWTVSRTPSLGGATLLWNDDHLGSPRKWFERGVNINGSLTGSDGVAISADALNDQYATRNDIKTDAAGNTYLLFRVTANSGDIWAQKLSPAGNPLWGANGVPVCQASGIQIYSRFCLDGLGGIIATWTDYRSGSGRTYAQRINSAGAAMWTTNGLGVAPGSTRSQVLPGIASDGLGGATIMWVDDRNYTGFPLMQDLYAQRIDGSGTPQWTADGLLIASAVVEQTSIIGGIDSVSGSTIFIWEDRRNASHYVTIYGQRLLLDGTQAWTAGGIPIRALISGTNIAGFNLVSDDFGGGVVVWGDDRGTAIGCYVQRIGPGGPLWTTDGVYLGTFSAQSVGLPGIVSDGSGGCACATGDASAQKGLRLSRLNASGVIQWAVGVRTTSLPSTVKACDICRDGFGGFIAVWYDYRNDPTGIGQLFIQRVNANGVRQWIADGIMAANSGPGQIPEPRIASALR